ncbi:MAG: hypothetical protein M3O02_11115 [Acidobacteriota bacterium]|nr:hypothetical protein [Acidobacteriota bacterium]
MCVLCQQRELEFRLDVATVALVHAALDRHHGDLAAATAQVELWLAEALSEARQRTVTRLMERQALRLAPGMTTTH